MAIDIDLIIDELGAYNRTRGKEIIRKMYLEDPTRGLFNVKSGIQDKYVLTQSETTEVIQGYQKAWTPKGDLVFKPNIIKARPVKVDFSFSVKDFEASWLGYLKTSGSSSDDMPISRFILEDISRQINR